MRKSFRCVKDFMMRDGSRSFTSGEVYHGDVNPSADYSSEYYATLLNDNHHWHSMSRGYFAPHFVECGVPGEQLQLL